MRFFQWWFRSLFPSFIPLLAAAAPAIAGAAASFIGNMVSSRSANSAQEDRQEQSQAFNAAEAEKQRQWQAEQNYISRYYNSAEAAMSREWSGAQAERQMGFQERMSNTQYQRAMSDMRTAGLNPILAYSQGGAGTPVGAQGSSAVASSSAGSGAAASSPTPQTPYRVDIGNLLSTAVQLAQIKNIEAQTGVSKATEDSIRQRTDIESKSEYTGDEQIPTRSGLEKSERWQLMRAERRAAIAREGLTEAERDFVVRKTDNAVKEGERIEADTGNIRVDTVLKQLAQAEAKAGSAYWSRFPESYGVSQGLKMTGEALGSAFGIKRLLGR